MLHDQTDACDADPAAEAHKERFAAGSDQLDDIAVQTDGCHGKDDKEFAQRLDRREERSRYAEVPCYCGNQRRQDEVNDEEREGFFKVTL